MRIVVKESEGKNIRLLLPTGMLLNRLTAGLARKALAERADVNLSTEQMMRLMREIKRYKRIHPDWVLVEVQSSDGNYVKIKP